VKAKDTSKTRGAIMAVKVLTDFACNISVAYGTTGLHEFHQGDIITDPNVAGELLRLGCQVAPVTDQDMVACPKCRTAFSSSAHSTQATIVKVNTSIEYDRSSYKWESGEVVQYPWFVDALKKAGIPLDTIDAVKCPKCETVFYDHPPTAPLRMQFARRP
jgi:hypothetical protein